MPKLIPDHDKVIYYSEYCVNKTSRGGAILLRRQGIAVTIYERRPGVCLYPQAHVVNTRTSEILREIGLWDALMAEAAGADRLKFVTWSESLAGRRFGKLPYQGNAEQAALRRASSPARTVNLGQDRLESLLVARLLEIGGSVEFGHQVTKAAIEGEAALLTVASQNGTPRVALRLRWPAMAPTARCAVISV